MSTANACYQQLPSTCISHVMMCFHWVVDTEDCVDCVHEHNEHMSSTPVAKPWCWFSPLMAVETHKLTTSFQQTRITPRITLYWIKDHAKEESVLRRMFHYIGSWITISTNLPVYMHPYGKEPACSMRMATSINRIRAKPSCQPPWPASFYNVFTVQANHSDDLLYKSTCFHTQPSPDRSDIFHVIFLFFLHDSLNFRV